MVNKMILTLVWKIIDICNSTTKQPALQMDSWRQMHFLLFYGKQRIRFKLAMTRLQVSPRFGASVSGRRLCTGLVCGQ